jgi:hypothetical protein
MLGFPQPGKSRDEEGVPRALADTAKKPDKRGDSGCIINASFCASECGWLNWFSGEDEIVLQVIMRMSVLGVAKSVSKMCSCNLLPSIN